MEHAALRIERLHAIDLQAQLTAHDQGPRLERVAVQIDKSAGLALDGERLAKTRSGQFGQKCFAQHVASGTSAR